VFFKFTLDRLLQLVENGAYVVHLSLLAGLQRVGQKLESILRAGVDCLQDGRASAIEAHPKGIEQRIVRRDGLRLVQPLLDTRDAFFPSERLIAQIAARDGRSEERRVGKECSARGEPEHSERE